MGNGHFQVKAIGHLFLKGVFPGPDASTVAAATVGQDQQRGGIGVDPASGVAPPLSDVARGKLRSVMGGSYEH